MSRSYKKTPWCGDHKGTEKKRMAWKSVRSWLKANPDVLLNGGKYRKVYEPWDICDYGSIMPWEEYWQDCIDYWEEYGKRRGEPFHDKKDEYRRWRKWHKNK